MFQVLDTSFKRELGISNMQELDQGDAVSSGGADQIAIVHASDVGQV